jgi:peptide/nickel transport system permease protein
MAEISPTMPSPAASAVKPKKQASTLVRVLRYTGIRILTLAVTVVIGLYLTILIANMGGHVDNIRLAQIREEVNARAANDPAMRGLPVEERAARIEAQIDNRIKRLGMDKPFVVRSMTYLVDAITLNLGRAEQLTSNSGSNQVRLIILERLPSTLILFATADIVLFFAALGLALALSRNYGSVFDKIAVALTPLSSAPGGFMGFS